MTRFLLPLAFILSWSLTAQADVAPPDKRGVDYTLKITNIKDFPNHVFIAYPTTNHGFGYVIEEGKPITRVLVRKSWKGEASALHAMTREAFDKANPNPPRHPHGDNRDKVLVVKAPPGPPASLRAAKTIGPPPLVPTRSRVVGVTKVFRIERLTDSIFELKLVREVVKEKKNKKGARKAEAQQGGDISAATGVVAAILGLGLVFGFSRSRRRRAP